MFSHLIAPDVFNTLPAEAQNHLTQAQAKMNEALQHAQQAHQVSGGTEGTKVVVDAISKATGNGTATQSQTIEVNQS